MCEERLKTAAALGRSIFFARIFWIDNLLFQYMEASKNCQGATVRPRGPGGGEYSYNGPYREAPSGILKGKDFTC